MSGSNGVAEYYPLTLEEPVESTASEEWAEIVWPDAKPGYMVSRQGEARGPSGKLLKVSPRGTGDTRWLSISSVTKAPSGVTSSVSIRIDKLLLITFVGEPGPDEVPIHRNGNPLDNRVDNLKWGTVDELPPGRRAYALPKKKPSPKAKAKKAKKVAAPPKPPTGGIEVLRVYRDGKLQITVDQDGHAKVPKLTYTAAELAKLAALCERAVEMNNLMKL